MKQQQTTRTAIRCEKTNKLLAYKDEHGLYLLCKECRAEQFFAWSELVSPSVEVLVTGPKEPHTS